MAGTSARRSGQRAGCQFRIERKPDSSPAFAVMLDGIWLELVMLVLFLINTDFELYAAGPFVQ